MRETNWQELYIKEREHLPWERTDFSWIKRLVDEKRIEGKHVLDLGCGTGRQGVELAKIPGVIFYTGVDISSEALNYARERFEDAGLTISCEFLAEDVVSWQRSYQGEPFDIILDCALLHCLDLHFREAYVDFIKNYLQKGGYYILRAFDKDGEEGVIEKGRSDVALVKENEAGGLFPFLELLEKNVTTPVLRDGTVLKDYLFQKQK